MHDQVIESGLLYGVFNTGPWLAYKTPGNDIRGWVGAGKQMFDFMVSEDLDFMTLTYV